jgi:hypothetical protein
VPFPRTRARLGSSVLCGRPLCHMPCATGVRRARHEDRGHSCGRSTVAHTSPADGVARDCGSGVSVSSWHGLMVVPPVATGIGRRGTPEAASPRTSRRRSLGNSNGLFHRLRTPTPCSHWDPRLGAAHMPRAARTARVRLCSPCHQDPPPGIAAPQAGRPTGSRQQPSGCCAGTLSCPGGRRARLCRGTAWPSRLPSSRRSGA